MRVKFLRLISVVLGLSMFIYADHTQTKYNSNDANTINAQINDLIARHFDGLIEDWYGSANTTIDGTLQKVRDNLASRCSAPQNCPLEFAAMIDQGVVKTACGGVTSGSCAVSAVESALCYLNGNYFGSNAYLKMNPSTHAWAVSTDPVVYTFPPSGGWNTTDWTTITNYANTSGWASKCPSGQQGNNGPVLIINQDTAGFSAPFNGAFSWVAPDAWSSTNQFNWNGYTGSNTNDSYHDNFYSNCNSHTGQICTGSAKKGFDDNNASWGNNRVVAQRCGQTWLNTLQKAALFSGSNLTLQIPTWNDYEEGTEIETGIDNCYRVNAPTLSNASTLNWTLNTNDSTYAPLSPVNGTIDHFIIWQCNTSDTNCQSIATPSPSTTSFNLSNTNLPAGTYDLWVQMVGINSILNQISSAKVAYTVAQLQTSITGSGTVTSTSSPTQTNQFNCSSGSCNVLFPLNTTITLTATAGTGYVFSSWTGCTSVSNNVCTVSLTTNSQSVTANFKTISPTYYIAATGGSDSYDGTEHDHTTGSTGPWTTFAHAIPLLKPGNTLVLENGTYTNPGSGCILINGNTNAVSGTATQPITIIAENERQAWIKGNTSCTPFQITDVAYWVIQGLHLSDADCTSATGQNTGCGNSAANATFTVGIEPGNTTNHITVRRNLVDHSNRCNNQHLMGAFYGANNSLFEENELYYFHRHGFINYNGSNNNVFRRNYANGRGYTQWGNYSFCANGYNPQNDDVAFMTYGGTNSTFENDIGENSISGFHSEPVDYGTTSHDNTYYGDIALSNGGNSYEIAPHTNQTSEQYNVFFYNFVGINASSVMVYIRCATNVQFHTSTLFATTTAPTAGYYLQDSELTSGCTPSSSIDHTEIVGTDAYTGYSITTGTSNITNSGMYPASAHSIANVTVTSPFTSNPGYGSCYLWAPNGSAAQTAGIGATVLYEYNNGTLTNTPLWGSASNNEQFAGCGAVITGINDSSLNSCINVQQRLNVNQNGCTYPSGYTGWSNTPQTLYSIGNQPPNTYVWYSNTLYAKTLPADVDSHRWDNNGAGYSGDQIVEHMFASGTGGAYSIICGAGTCSTSHGGADYYATASDPVYDIVSVQNPPNTGTYNPTGKFFHITNKAVWDGATGDQFLWVWDQSSDIDSTSGGRIFTAYYGTGAPNPLPNCTCTTTSCAASTSSCQLALYYAAYGYPGTDIQGYNEGPQAWDSHDAASGILLLRNYEWMPNGSIAGVTSGTIRHALFLNSLCDYSNYVFPAFGNAGYCGNASVAPGTDPQMPSNGNLFYIDSSYNCAIAAVWAQPVCTAMQTYGGYRTDSGGTAPAPLYISRIEGPEAYDLAGLTDPEFAYMRGQSSTCSGVTCNSTSATQEKSLLYFFAAMPGLVSSNSTHLHIADPCIAKGLAGMTAAQGACF